jgi:dihydroneopterin aldolase
MLLFVLPASAQQQEKVRRLINKNKSLDEVKNEFAENEGRLVESIYNEIKECLKTIFKIVILLNVKT